MSDFPETTGLRSLLPAEPGRWAWSRVKVYLAVLAVVVVGFFLFADWYVAPAGSDALSWLHLAQVLLGLLTAVAGWRIARHEIDKQHHQSSK